MTTPTLEQITTAFADLGEEQQLGLIAMLIERLPDDLHDELCDGLENAAQVLGLSIADMEGMDEEAAGVWASNFASELVRADNPTRARSIQNGLEWIDRRRAMLNPKVAA